MRKQQWIGLVGGVCLVVGFLLYFNSRSSMERERDLWRRLTLVQANIGGVRTQLAPQLVSARDDLMTAHLDAAEEKIQQLERWTRTMGPQAGAPMTGKWNGKAGGGQRPWQTGPNAQQGRSRPEMPPAASLPPMPGQPGAPNGRPGAPMPNTPDAQWEQDRQRLTEFVRNLPPEQREAIMRGTMTVYTEIQQGRAPVRDTQAVTQGLHQLVRRASSGQLNAEGYLAGIRQLQARLNAATRGATRPPVPAPPGKHPGKAAMPRFTGYPQPPRPNYRTPSLPPFNPDLIAGLLRGSNGRPPQPPGGGGAETPRLTNARLVLTVDPKTAGLTVRDRVTGRQWTTFPTVAAHLENPRLEDHALTASLEGEFPCRLRISLGSTAADVRIEITPAPVLSPGEQHEVIVHYPPPFAAAKTGRIALPLRKGPSFASAASAAKKWTLIATDLTAPWFGYGEPKAGYLAVITPVKGWESSLGLDRTKGGGMAPALVWRGDAGALGTTLVVTYRFTSDATFPGLERAYRTLAAAIPAAAGQRS